MASLTPWTTRNAHEIGASVLVSTNGGARWEVLGGNLPSTQVSDLQYHPQDKVLVISTYGRGMFAMDVSSIR